MKKNFINFTVLILLIIFLLMLLFFSNDVSYSVLNALKIWKENIIPCLFPFFVISDLLINYGFIDLFGEITKNIIGKLFNLPKESSFVIIASMLTGTPSSAKYTKELLDKKIISSKQANYLLSFTHFPNPLFILKATSSLVPNANIGLYIFISIIVGNIIIGLFFKEKNNFNFKKEKINLKKTLYNISIKNRNNNFIKILTNSIIKSTNSLILILGIIIFFFIISVLINNLLNISYVNNALLSGLLEITQGIEKIVQANIPINQKLTIITMFLTFGGISIHAQTISLLDNKDIHYINYLISRIFHSIISGIIILIIYNFLLR